MPEFWAYASTGKLFFAYRARKYSTSPPSYLNATELTAVVASAYDQFGNPLTVTQQPSYVASLGGYVGWIDGPALVNKPFVSIRLSPTIGPGVPAEWAPDRTLDVNVSEVAASFTMAQIVDAVWDEQRSEHVAAGSFGQMGPLLEDTRSAVLHPTYGLAALDLDLNALLTRIGVDGTVSLHQKLGALTATENLKAILGDLSTSKRLGQILGAFTETQNLKALLGDFSDVQNLKAVLGAYTAALPLKAQLDAMSGSGFDPSTDSLEKIRDELGGIRTTDIPGVLAILNHATYGLAALRALLLAIQASIGAGTDPAGADTVRGQLRSVIDTYLAAPNIGLAALNADLDELLARTGITTDTGGTVTTGTVMAKLNKLLQDLSNAIDSPDIEFPGTQPVP